MNYLLAEKVTVSCARFRRVSCNGWAKSDYW